MYLSTTVRECHRALGYGSDSDFEEEDEDDEFNPNVLDGVYLAGERFDQMVKREKVLLRRKSALANFFTLYQGQPSRNEVTRAAASTNIQ
jgi:hypothetical protein